MGHTRTDAYEEEAKETVEAILETYRIPRDVRQETELLYENGEYIEALDFILHHR